MKNPFKDNDQLLEIEASVVFQLIYVARREAICSFERWLQAQEQKPNTTLHDLQTIRYAKLAVAEYKKITQSEDNE